MHEWEFHFFGGFTIGIIFVIFVVTCFWHLAESKCQTAHNVADCEGAIRFQPAEVIGETK